MRRSVGQERTLERSDGKSTPLMGMTSGCLFHLTLKLNIIQQKILMFIKLSDVDTGESNTGESRIKILKNI